MNIKLSEQAQADIERIDSWWAEHRPLNPRLFRDELRFALKHIASAPLLSSVYVSRAGKKLRKVPLGRSREVIYSD